MRFSLLARARLAVFLVAVTALIAACAAKATVQVDPSEAEAQRVRVLAVRVADAVKLSLTIADEAGRLAGSLPLSSAVKNDIDCAILRVTGPSGTATAATAERVKAACGSIPASPLKAALEELQWISARPQLSNTIQRVGAATSPLIDRLEASGNPGLRALAAVLRTAFAFVSELSPAPIAWRLLPAWEVA